MPATREAPFLRVATDGELDSDGIDLGPPPAKREVRRTRDLSPEFWSGKFWSGGPKFSVENWSGRTREAHNMPT